MWRYVAPSFQNWRENVCFLFAECVPSVLWEQVRVFSMDSSTCVFDSVICSEKDMQRFPVKLWRIIEGCSTGAISWGDTGKTVRIHKQLFEEQYMKAEYRLFNTESFTSLVRQMNLYGFRKVLRLHDPDPEISEYFHPCFTREYKDFSKIQRKGTKQNGPRDTYGAFERVLQINGQKGVSV